MATNPFAAYAELWLRAFDFGGRSRRAAFWGALLIDLLIVCVLQFFPSAQMVYSVCCIVPTLAVAVRRLHDSSRTAWWLLTALLPVVGGVILLVLLLFDSDGANAYGSSPKYGDIPF